MKHEKDRFTAELPLPGVLRRPGRPAKPDALSPADRARAYRLRKKEIPVPVEKIYTQGDFDKLQQAMIFSRNAMWKMESTILAMQKEQAVLIEERGKLFDRVATLLAEQNGLRAEVIWLKKELEKK